MASCGTVHVTPFVTTPVWGGHLACNIIMVLYVGYYICSYNNYVIWSSLPGCSGTVSEQFKCILNILSCLFHCTRKWLKKLPKELLDFGVYVYIVCWSFGNQGFLLEKQLVFWYRHWQDEEELQLSAKRSSWNVSLVFYGVWMTVWQPTLVSGTYCM